MLFEKRLNFLAQVLKNCFLFIFSFKSPETKKYVFLLGLSNLMHFVIPLEMFLTSHYEKQRREQTTIGLDFHFSIDRTDRENKKEVEQKFLF